MKPQDRYDVVVAGDHPAALWLAASLAQSGRSVLHAPLRPAHSVHLTRRGQCLDPEPNVWAGLANLQGAHGLLYELILAVGATSPGLNAVAGGEREALPMVMSPRHRVRAHHDWSVTTEEFSRDQSSLQGSREPEVDFAPLARWTSALSGALLSVPERIAKLQLQSKKRPVVEFDLTKVLREATKAAGLGEFEFADAAREWAQGAIGSVYGLSDKVSLEAFTPETLTHRLALSPAAAQFRGGASAFRNYLLSLGTRASLQVRPQGEECRRIFVEDGRVVGVQIGSEGRMIATQTLIVAASSDQVDQVLYESGADVAPRMKYAPIPVGWRFTVALSVRTEAIPEGFGRRGVWKEAGADLLEIECAPTEEYGLGKTERTLVFLRSVLPWSPEALRPEMQRVRAGRMVRQLRELWPFLDFHTHQMAPDFRLDGEESVVEFSEAYPFASLLEVPENLRVYSHASGRRSLSAGIQGLIPISGELFPEWGNFGPFLAAILARSVLDRDRASDRPEVRA